MSGGVPRRVQISRTQRNTPSKSGNVVAKKALVLCSGRRSRRAMCNYVMRRTHAETKKEVGANPWWYDNADVLAAIAALTSYFASHSLRFVLVGESETLATDLVPTLLPEHINHYERGRPLYDTLPSIYLQRAVDLINSINLELAVILDSGTVPMRHIVGAVTPQVAATLEADATPYGVPISFSSNVEVTAYGSSTWCVPTNFPNGTATGGPLCYSFGICPCKFTAAGTQSVFSSYGEIPNGSSSSMSIWQSETNNNFFSEEISPSQSPWFGYDGNSAHLLWYVPEPGSNVIYYKL